MQEIFELSSDIRYAAVYQKGVLQLEQRNDLVSASASESDRYEELLVNPTLLMIARQRGNIDCGGFEYLVVRYGNFFQIVHPIFEGHISIAVEATAQPLDILALLKKSPYFQKLVG